MRISILAILLFFFYAGFGQKVFQPKQIDYGSKGLIYKTEKTFSAHVNTNGYGVGMTKGEIKTYYKTNYYSLDFSYVKDSRELKQNKNLSTINEGSSSFIYGKQKSLYMFRFGMGSKMYLSEKAIRKGLAVGLNYEVGLSLGLLKPYNLKVVYVSDEDFQTEIREEIYSEATHERFLEYDGIFGGGRYTNNLFKSSITVGGQAKLGALFAFGAYDRYVKAIETGVRLDVFAQKVPLLIEREDIRNRRYILSIYVAAQIGRRE